MTERRLLQLIALLLLLQLIVAVVPAPFLEDVDHPTRWPLSGRLFNWVDPPVYLPWVDRYAAPPLPR